MILSTERLTLLPLTSQDIDWFHATNIDCFVRKHLWDNKVINRDLVESILKQNEQLFEQGNWGLWKIIDTVNKEPMGMKLIDDKDMDGKPTQFFRLTAVSENYD